MSGASGPDGASLQVTELAARCAALRQAGRSPGAQPHHVISDAVTELAARGAALRQAARSRGAQPHDVLDAAFTELEGAIELIRAAEAGPGGSAGPAAGGPPPGSDHAERS